jgi:uncharacterized UPF0146 family protein
MGSQPVITERLAFNDHHAMAAHWGEQTVRAIRAAIAQPHPTTSEDYDLTYAVRCARHAHGHAVRADRRLRP